METEEKTTPRKRDEAATAALGSSVTPMGRSSSSTTPGPGGSNPTPGTPFTRFSSSSSSDKNSVLLSDWWLVKAESGAGGKRLAVSGFTSRQQAVRIFSSAPVVKRYDAYTLETEDGITVIIQGMINKIRTRDNGFPPEVCNRFLVGFPYNWDYYADEYLRKSSTCSSNSSSSAGSGEQSKDSAVGAGGTSPVCVKEFPVRRICDILISSGDTLSRNFTENLKKFFRDPSLNQILQKPFFAGEKCSEHEMDKSDQKYENDKGFATAIIHDAEGHVTSHAEEGGRRNDLHAGNVLEENSDFNHDISYDSLMHESRETDSQPAVETTCQTETGTAMQREMLLTKTREVEKDNDLASSVPMDCDNVDHVPDCIEGKESVESRLDSCNVGMNCLLKGSLPKESILSKHEHEEEPGDDAVRRQHHVEILRIPNVGVSDDLLVPKDCDPKNANSLNVKMSVGSENYLVSDVTKSLKAPMTQDDRTSSKISSQNEVMVHSTVLVFQGDADSHHVEGRGRDLNNLKSPNVGITRISKDSSSNEIDNMCHSIFEKIERCKFPAARDPTSPIGSAADMKSTRASEVKKSPINKHLTKVVKKAGRKKESIQKKDQKCAECINSKVCLHGTEELSSTGNVQDDVPLITLRTRNVHRNSSASSEGKPVESSTNVKANALSTRMKSSKKKGYDNQMAGCSPEVEKIGVGSALMDHNIVNAANDTKHASRHKHTQGVMHRQGHLDNSAKEQSSSNKTLAMSGENILKITNDQNAKISEVLIMEQPSGEKTLHTTRRKTAWRPISSAYQTPNTRGKARQLSMASPESLNLKRSRSGRLIVPPLANWCQQIIYNADGSIAGIRGAHVLNSPKIGSQSEPVKKRKKFT
ncbi:kinetochore-associated protein KNL-2 homolog isoform X2 [Phoenix dactylifera]|uniref:Kinetochore-associated protein KNL-2 homolog isoform X2 n=1 Tax=Phoenix dactylifera TaxID=42345 RepID=A0A8B7CTV6_PHODC|nr:kinetochore-associated protein KNL-2 homolog isoform X2 [Phoenix dactylifera]